MAAATVKVSSFLSALRVVVVVVVIFFAYIVLGTSASSSSSSVWRTRSRSCRWLLPCQILQKGGVAVVRQLTENVNADGADAVPHFSPQPAPPRPRPLRLHQQHGPNLHLHPDAYHPYHYHNDSRSQQQRRRRKEKHVINTGQRVGLLFAGIAVLLQVVIVTYLLLKRKRMLDLVNKYECHHVADDDWPPPRF